MKNIQDENRNIATGQKSPGVEKFPAKKRGAMIFLVLMIFVMLILVTNKDAMSSLGFISAKKENIEKERTAEKKEEPKKEESNIIKDVYLKKIDRADDAKRKANLADIRLSLEFYFSENGSYPASIDAVKLSDPNTVAHKDLIKYTNSANLKDPKDPEFFYLYRSDGKSFEISARLENEKDPECAITDGGICIYKVVGP